MIKNFSWVFPIMGASFSRIDLLKGDRKRGRPFWIERGAAKPM
jgi:hypothetical protein